MYLFYALYISNIQYEIKTTGRQDSLWPGSFCEGAVGFKSGCVL